MSSSAIKRSPFGVVAAGHKETVNAGISMLDAGGNAFDAVLAAWLVACVAEPVLTSLGGGGFLTSLPVGKKAKVYDFFVQTPGRKPTNGADFYPVTVDFGGGNTQVFHAGMASIAVPGGVKGLFKIHESLCSMPLNDIIFPACKLARDGVEVNALQARFFKLVGEIYKTKEGLDLYGSPSNSGEILKEGDVFKCPSFADALESLAMEGEDLFYKGEMASTLIKYTKEAGGYITAEDLSSYEVDVVDPVTISYRGSEILLPPPPSSGGLLVAFTLKLLEKHNLANLAPDSNEKLLLLAKAMKATSLARAENLDDKLFEEAISEEFLSEELLEKFSKLLRNPNPLGSTTQISVADGQGNIASMTTTNGEGSGRVLPGTGIMLNNMLGEEDLNPGGFGLWKESTRLTSMMAPVVMATPDGTRYALGSGGSSRIRTAIVQAISAMLDHGTTPEEAVALPRLHFENEVLHVEKGIPVEAIDYLDKSFKEVRPWKDMSMFFGGVNIAGLHPESGKASGGGDPRRGGAVGMLD